MPRKPSLTETNATLGALLRQPYEMLSEWLYAELARQGFDDVRPAFSAVLRNLPGDGASVSELASRAGMTKQSMGYLVEQMRAANLVAIVPHEKDRRANTVRLTVRGEEAINAALALSRQSEEHLIALIGERKVEQLRKLLQEASAALEGLPVREND